MDLELNGKRAIITGGSRGIGLAVARVLVAEGTSVAIAARDRETLDKASAELRDGASGRVVGVEVDTRNDDSVANMVAETVQELGGVDILVNAAAKPDAVATNLASLTNEMFWQAIDTKVLGYLRCIRSVAPHMCSQRWGRIVNISGLAARSSGSLNGAMRNVAVAAMTKSLADELGRDGVNITVVHPGVTRTSALDVTLAERAERDGVEVADVERQVAGATTIGRIVDAEEVAWVVGFLASPKSVSITGDAIAVGGGQVGPIFY
jgi:NAD(P)-dependent dehydrogenase (short-subunit alcohol dehydrogenase family)